MHRDRTVVRLLCRRTSSTRTLASRSKARTPRLSHLATTAGKFTGWTFFHKHRLTSLRRLLRPPSQDMSHFMSDSPASSSDMSTPISPMSLNFETEFQYSEHIPSDFGHFVGDAGPEHPFGDDVHLFEHHDDLLRPKSAQSIVHHGWDALHSDDRTPRGLDNADMLMYP